MASSNLQLDAHIPVALKEPLLLMSSSPAVTGNIPTIFVGIVHEQYTDDMWDNHAKRLGNLFGINDPTCIRHLKAVSPATDSTVVDGEKLAREVTQAMQLMNQLQYTTIRIVGMGVGWSTVVTEALESLIRGWEIPADKKAVQFIALGDSENFHYLNFCKSIVIKQMCKELQFYSTMDYNNFGYLRPSPPISHLELKAMEKQLRASKISHAKGSS